MKRLIQFSLLLVIIFTLSACAKSKPTPNTDETEVLMARDCGLDKLQCCNEEPACSFAQKCCLDPNDKARNYCSDECGCGAQNEFCCQGNKCNDGLTCSNGNCTACGGKGQPCCTDGRCGNDLICSNSNCVTCGETGNPCCENNHCKMENKQDKTRAECIGNICQQCGTTGMIGCVNDKKCLMNNLFSNDFCYSCGKDNEPCCDANSGVGYDCDAKAGLKCNLGFCSPDK